MKEKSIKPISIVREEFIKNIADVINDSMLPAFIIEPILKDMYLESKVAAQRQYESDKRQYEECLKNDCLNKNTDQEN